MIASRRKCESERMAWSCFYLNSMVRGYHEYQASWSDPYVGEELICEQEVGNSHDPQAVALKKKLMVTFGLLATYLEEYRPAALFSFGGVVVSSAQ